MFHHESSLATTPVDIQALPSDKPMSACLSFEFFPAFPSIPRAATLRLSICLQPNVKQAVKVVPVVPPPHMRTQLNKPIKLPITLYQLAERLRDVHHEARRCFSQGGGTLYDLGKEIESLAKARGEKSASADLQRMVSQKGSRIMKRLHRIKNHGKPKEPVRQDSVRLTDEAFYITPFNLSEFG